MDMSALSTTQLGLIGALLVILAGGIAAWILVRKRRTARLHTRFGAPEYARAVREDGNQRRAEAKLEERTERVESFHIRALAPGDHTRFVESWCKVQSRFVDSPSEAITEADQLLGDVDVQHAGIQSVTLNSVRQTSQWTIRWLWKTTGQPTESRFAKHRIERARKNCARR